MAVKSLFANWLRNLLGGCAVTAVACGALLGPPGRVDAESSPLGMTDLARAEREADPGTLQQTAGQRFVYAPGAQGHTYYAAPAAPRRPAATANRPQSVGPGARNWATGNRVPLHRPWLRSM